MYRKSARRSSLFLLELMISILMFSVASAWCVRLFVTARSVVKETEEQNRAQNLVAGYAELFLASENFDAFLLSEGAEKPDALPSGDRMKRIPALCLKSEWLRRKTLQNAIFGLEDRSGGIRRSIVWT